MATVKRHNELDVYQLAFSMAIEIHTLTNGFPKEEKYSLTDQIRRSSRSVCANIAEAWRKRKYVKSFIAKLNDAEGEASETQVWLEFSTSFGYLDNTKQIELQEKYNQIIGSLVKMSKNADQWYDNIH